MARERPVDPPPHDPSTETVDPMRTTPMLPDRIGRYHVKRVIASGGMGTVYEATQDNPRRVVAVKVMRQGIASKSALRRFEYEGQILGRLRHPGIAQIYEAGTHDDGHGAVPYFAMEYIPNAKTITKYADEKKLGTRQRMELFAKVCDAIHHGHQKGIIHRDLKPSNILVDSTSQVKIIDFGVARSTDSDMAVTTLQTDVGQLIGTLQYMSPEQCEADPHDIDIRSDVYALGVVFYELLCGKPPYDVTRMAVYEATRVIREQHPTKLSTLDRTLRGDVETIALKALEKERERRYQSTADFAHDIQRYLTGEAILARRASIVYQLRLFAHRNKGVFAALAALFVILVTATIVSTSLYLRAEAARGQAEKNRAEAEAAQTAETEQRQLAESQRDRATAAEQEADTRRAQAEAVTGFLRNMLTSIQPARAKGREISVREVLDEASKTIGTRLGGQPLIEAEVRNVIAWTYREMGMVREAIPHWESVLEILRRERGAEHPEVLAATDPLGDAYWKAGHVEKGVELLESSLRIARQTLGDRDPLTLRLMANLGNIYPSQRRYLLGQPLLEQAVEGFREHFGENDYRTTDAMGNLAFLYDEQGRRNDAFQLFRPVLAFRRRVYGDENLVTIGTMTKVARMCLDRKELDEAERLAGEAVRSSRLAVGDDAGPTGAAMDVHAQALEALGRYAEAEGVLLEIADAERRSRRFGDLCGSYARLGKLANVQRQQDHARTYASELKVVARLVADSNQPNAGDANTCAMMLLTFEPAEARDAQTALEVAQKAVEWSEAKDPLILDTLAQAYELSGDLEKAVETQQATLGLVSATTDFRWRRLLETNLLRMLRKKGDLGAIEQVYQAAERRYRENLSSYRATLPEGHPTIATGLLYLSWTLVDHGSYAEAEPLMRECLAIRQRALSENRAIANAMVILGASLAGQGRFDEAETLLLDACQRRKSNPEMPMSLPDVIGHVVRLYESWDAAEPGQGYAEKAAEWRAKLEETPK